jgi:hypothetical protein
MQDVQTVEDEQVAHPTGQMIGTPPETLVAKLIEGLFMQVFVELKENPLEHWVQTVLLVQVRQLSEQAEQAPEARKNLAKQELQAVEEVQTKQLEEQAIQALPLLKNPSLHLHVNPSKICPVWGQDEGGRQDLESVERVK